MKTYLHQPPPFSLLLRLYGAQSDPEYKMEIGAGVGMMGLLRRLLTSRCLKDLQPMGTVLARYNLSPYMGLKMNVSFGR